MGLLTLALCARAGAFFVLPAVVVAGTYAFRGQSRWSPRFLVASLLAVSIGFGVNAALTGILKDPSSRQSSFSNFSNTLYGLVVEGKGWAQVRIDHPGVCGVKPLWTA